MITVIGGTFLVESSRPEPFRRFHQAHHRPRLLTCTLVKRPMRYERFGSNGLAVYLERIESEARVNGFLFDDNFNELANRVPPRKLLKLPDKSIQQATAIFRVMVLRP